MRELLGRVLPGEPRADAVFRVGSKCAIARWGDVLNMSPERASQVHPGVHVLDEGVQCPRVILRIGRGYCWSCCWEAARSNTRELLCGHGAALSRGGRLRLRGRRGAHDPLTLPSLPLRLSHALIPVAADRHLLPLGPLSDYPRRTRQRSNLFHQHLNPTTAWTPSDPAASSASASAPAPAASLRPSTRPPQRGTTQPLTCSRASRPDHASCCSRLLLTLQSPGQGPSPSHLQPHPLHRPPRSKPKSATTSAHATIGSAPTRRSCASSDCCPPRKRWQVAINTSASSKVSGIRLLNWWPERQGRRVVVGGMCEDSGQPWRTSAIETRHTACVLSTYSGTVYELVGPADQDRARHYGCPQATAALFSDGFPPSWSSSSTWEEEEEEGGEWETGSDSEFEYPTSSRTLQCPLCGRGDFKNLRGFKIHASRCKKEHIQRQLGTARTECQYCGRDDFETAHGLKIHEGSCKKRRHGPDGDKRKAARRSARQAEQSSSDDGKEEEDAADELSHSGSQEEEDDDVDGLPPCQYCGKSGFKNVHGLRVHEGRCKNSVPRAKGKNFVCSECGVLPQDRGGAQDSSHARARTQNDRVRRH